MAMEIFTVGRGQEGYPERLMPFADMPSRLFVRGALPADEQKTAAIVGARICTAYGKSQAAFFAQVLAANGVAVISGLACGIDAAAHEGALRGKGKTFAVLGCGVDICYPKQNYPLQYIFKSKHDFLFLRNWKYQVGSSQTGSGYTRRLDSYRPLYAGG